MWSQISPFINIYEKKICCSECDWKVLHICLYVCLSPGGSLWCVQCGWCGCVIVRDWLSGSGVMWALSLIGWAKKARERKMPQEGFGESREGSRREREREQMCALEFLCLCPGRNIFLVRTPGASPLDYCTRGRAYGTWNIFFFLNPENI